MLIAEETLECHCMYCTRVFETNFLLCHYVLVEDPALHSSVLQLTRL